MPTDRDTSSSELYSTTPPPKSLQQWRDEAYSLIKRLAKGRGNHLLPILMALGKTWAAGNLPADPDVDHPITVFTKQIDTREQIRDYAREAGVDPKRIKMLPVFNRDCPTCKGEHDDKELPDHDMTWSELMKTLQSQLVPPSTIHEQIDKALPCQHEGRCPYSAACDFDAEDYDLLIGHPVHANILSYVENRIVLFDEDAGGAFEYVVNQNDYTKAISVFLEHHADIEATSVNDLIRADDKQRDEWTEAIANRDNLTDPEIGYSTRGGRADAPMLALAVLNGEAVENETVTDTNLRRLEVGKSVVLYDEGKDRNDPCITVRNPPHPISGAWSVVAMDGTPTQSIWEGRLGLDLHYVEDFMTASERATYVRDVLGYEIIQLTESETVFSANAENVCRWKFNGYLHAISDAHDRMVPTITSSQAKEGIIHGRYVKNKELHFGKIRSHSELENETLLAVLGALHPGDRAIQRLAALDGYAVESNGESGVNKSYGEVGDRYYHHLVHNEVAQAIFRVARDDDVPGATIYVYTACIPDWIPRNVVTERPAAWSPEMKKTIRVLERQGSAMKGKLVNITDHAESTVGKHLRRLKQEGLVDDVPGIDGYKEWIDTGLSERNPHGRFTIESDNDFIEDE